MAHRGVHPFANVLENNLKYGIFRTECSNDVEVLDVIVLNQNKSGHGFLLTSSLHVVHE